jgi:hypothetical protein
VGGDPGKDPALLIPGLRGLPGFAGFGGGHVLLLAESVGRSQLEYKQAAVPPSAALPTRYRLGAARYLPC